MYSIYAFGVLQMIADKEEEEREKLLRVIEEKLSQMAELKEKEKEELTRLHGQPLSDNSLSRILAIVERQQANETALLQAVEKIVHVLGGQETLLIPVNHKMGEMGDKKEEKAVQAAEYKAAKSLLDKIGHLETNQKKISTAIRNIKKVIS